MQNLTVPIAVYCDDKEKIEEARRLAELLSLPFQKDAQVHLFWHEEKWSLKQKGCTPICVDFDVTQWRYGKITRQEGLIRACKPHQGQVIVDLTAGLARDAALLVHFGATLILVERDKIMNVLLEDGIKRGIQAGLLINGQVTLIKDEALDYLNTLTPKCFPDVIYYDPMHPTRTKSAKVKKALQCLQTWLPVDNDMNHVLLAARAHVKERVVMKWPAKQSPVAKVNYQIPGKTIRFDVYSSHYFES